MVVSIGWWNPNLYIGMVGNHQKNIHDKNGLAFGYQLPPQRRRIETGQVWGTKYVYASSPTHAILIRWFAFPRIDALSEFFDFPGFFQLSFPILQSWIFFNKMVASIWKKKSRIETLPSMGFYRLNIYWNSWIIPKAKSFVWNLRIDCDSWPAAFCWDNWSLCVCLKFSWWFFGTINRSIYLYTLVTKDTLPITWKSLVGDSLRIRSHGIHHHKLFHHHLGNIF